MAVNTRAELERRLGGTVINPNPAGQQYYNTTQQTNRVPGTVGEQTNPPVGLPPGGTSNTPGAVGEFNNNQPGTQPPPNQVALPPTYPGPIMDPRTRINQKLANQRGGNFNGDIGPVDLSQVFDQAYLDALRGRMMGQGLPGFQEVIDGTFTPQANVMDRQYDRAQEQAMEELVSRGVLQSGETARMVQDYQAELADRKAALFGQIAQNYENMKQENIRDALRQYGDLAQSALQSKTTIKAAQIGAEAQVLAASIGAQASIAAAQISAHATLQASAWDYEVALRSIDNKLAMEGIDPQRWATDPKYRHDTIGWFAYMSDTRFIIEREKAKAEFGITLPGMESPR